MRDENLDPIEVLLLNYGHYSPFRVDEAFQSVNALNKLQEEMSYLELYECLKLELLKEPRVQRQQFIDRVAFHIRARFNDTLNRHIEHLQELTYERSRRTRQAIEEESEEG